MISLTLTECLVRARVTASQAAWLGATTRTLAPFFTALSTAAARVVVFPVPAEQIALDPGYGKLWGIVQGIDSMILMNFKACKLDRF